MEPTRPSAAALRSWRRIATLGALFLALVVGFAAYDMVRSYRDTVDQSGRDLNASAVVIAEQAARSLQTIDIVLQNIATDYRRGWVAAQSASNLHAYLANQAVGLQQMKAIVLLDDAGNAWASSSTVEADRAALEKWSNPVFDALREHPDAGLLVGATRRIGGSQGQWVFPIARRLETASGQFAGVVLAQGRVAYYQTFYRDVHPVGGAMISLLHQNGTLLAREPSADVSLGQRFALVERLIAASRASRGETLRLASPLDGLARFVAFAPVTGYPLFIGVTRNVDRVLKPWREQAMGTALRTLALALLAAVLLALLRRQFVHLDQARSSLEESRERFALAAAGSDVGIWSWSAASDVIFASPRALEIFGLGPGPERRPRDAWFAAVQIHPDDAAARQQAIDAHFVGTAPAYFGEYRVRHPDSEYRWIRVRGLCVRDGSGQPLRMAGSVADIDAEQRATVALRLSEERFALAVAGSDDGVWDYDYSAGQAFASQRAQRILGLPTQPEVQPLDDWMAHLPIHPDDRRGRLAAIDAHLSGDTPAYTAEWRVVPPDGAVRWVRVRGVCVRDAGGKPLRMAGSVADIDAQKRAEEALRQSEKRYALAVAGSDDGVWDWNYETGMAFESARARELQGLPAGPEQQPMAELMTFLQVHPDDVTRREQALRAHLTGQTPAYECEYRVCHADGSVRWIRVRAVCLRDGAGQPARMAGSVTDIDARKRAEEALRQSEQRFALAVAGSNDGILDWDIVHDSMYLSERALQIIGIDALAAARPRAEWAALANPLICPDDVERVRAVIDGLHSDDRQVHDGEFRVRQADGQYGWVRLRGMHVCDASGRPIRWAGSISDINASKQAQEALRRSEERFHLAVAGSNEGIWDWDLKTDQLFLSARAQELLWLEASEPQRLRRYWIARTHYHPDDVARVRAAISAHLRGQTGHFMVEYRLRHHPGEWHWYRQRGIAVRDAQGRPTRMAGSMEDISDRKNAEADRDRLEGQLLQAKKLEAIGTLAGGIAHDFNNILAAILGYGELAQQEAADNSPLRRHIDAAISAAMRAKSLVERILAFSRSGMGDRAAIQAQSIVAEALDATAASLPSGIRLERRLDAPDATVLGDPTQVHQVVMNLCANAIQAMRSSGTLAVTLDEIDQGAPMCATCNLPPGRYLRLAVQDTGAGIAPAILEQIFDPFFTTRAIGVGTGLGLSLVHGIVTDLGGGIEVDSQVGDGSTFTVYLPLHDGVALALAPAAPVVAAGGQGQTILLVDDEETLVRLGEEMIAGLGYEPVGFTSGSLALQTFAADPARFDAVLSDEAMPEMTGTELARAIHRIRLDIPVVLMSGYVSPALSARSRNAGVREVLSKPLASSDIARSLANALRR